MLSYSKNGWILRSSFTSASRRVNRCSNRARLLWLFESTWTKPSVRFSIRDKTDLEISSTNDSTLNIANEGYGRRRHNPVIMNGTYTRRSSIHSIVEAGFTKIGSICHSDPSTMINVAYTFGACVQTEHRLTNVIPMNIVSSWRAGMCLR